MTRTTPLITIAFGIAFLPAGLGAVEAFDKPRLLAEMKKGISELEAAVAGLSQSQWSFKPGSDKWSIADIIEHLIVSEEQYLAEVRGAMFAPARPELAARTKGNDQRVIDFMDQETPHVAIQLAQPMGRFASPLRLIEVMRQHRRMAIEMIESIPETELRNHFIFRGKGSELEIRDVYQFLLTQARHTPRHILQIHRNQADSRYPR